MRIRQLLQAVNRQNALVSQSFSEIQARCCGSNIKSFKRPRQSQNLGIFGFSGGGAPESNGWSWRLGCGRYRSNRSVKI
jgi:hypothetical protein